MNSFSIGADLGGTITKIALVKDNTIIDTIKFESDSQKGLLASLPLIEVHVDTLLHKNNVEHCHLNGIGLAFPGLVDCISKKILSTNKKYDDAPGLNLESWAQQKWQTALYIENDARMAAVGEWKFGAAAGCDNIVAVTIGTGIGSAAIIEGKLLRGKHFQAGVLGGHLSLNHKGNKCTCGNIGCAEAEASTWNIGEKIKNHPLYTKSVLADQNKLDFEVLFHAAKNNDALAVDIKNECLQIWSTAVINLIHAYDPEIVVLNGGILNSKEVIMPAIQKAVEAYAWCPWGKVSIQSSTLLDKAAILGVTYCLHNHL